MIDYFISKRNDSLKCADSGNIVKGGGSERGGAEGGNEWE